MLVILSVCKHFCFLGGYSRCMCMRELDVHGCVGTCVWRPEIDVTEHKGNRLMFWGLSFLIARLTKLSPSYKLSAVSGFILVGGVWDAGSKGADVGIKKHQTQ